MNFLDNCNIIINDSIREILSTILSYKTTISYGYSHDVITIDVHELDNTTKIVIYFENVLNNAHIRNFKITLKKHDKVVTRRYNIDEDYFVKLDLLLIIDQLYLKKATKKELETIRTIFVHDKICPICESKMTPIIDFGDTIATHCINKCYRITKSPYDDNLIASVAFFNQPKHDISSKDNLQLKLFKIKKIEREIYNYKHNEKYLLDILTEN